MKKALNIIYYVIVGLLALVALFLIWSITPLSGDYKIFVVQSGSMMPTIKTGSLVFTRPEKTYKVGDIVTFGPNTKTQTPTTHRIVAEKDGKFTTRGDANNGPDLSAITSSDIIGKMYLKIPYVGYAVAAARQPFGFMLIIIIPAVIIIYDELRKVVAEAKNIRKKKKDKTLGMSEEMLPASSTPADKKEEQPKLT